LKATVGLIKADNGKMMSVMRNQEKMFTEGYGDLNNDTLWLR
jgi:hypothetical protein